MKIWPPRRRATVEWVNTAKNLLLGGSFVLGSILMMSFGDAVLTSLGLDPMPERRVLHFRILIPAVLFIGAMSGVYTLVGKKYFKPDESLVKDLLQTLSQKDTRLMRFCRKSSQGSGGARFYRF